MLSIKIILFSTLVLLVSLSLIKIGESFLYLNENQNEQIRLKRAVKVSTGSTENLAYRLYNISNNKNKDKAPKRRMEQFGRK
uniref:Uncharacterized protein n=1 Tax=Strongyloides stercoralis TaxID=6248 RepID=A0A0K0EA95_STRER